MSKKTLKTVAKSKNNAIAQIKNNQKKLLENCQRAEDKKQPDDEYTEQGSKIRNRIETRNIQIFENPQKYLDKEIRKEWGQYANTIIRVERNRKEFQTELKEWKTSHEIAYYISTINLKEQNNLTAQEYATAIKNHWGIENRNHCVKDISMDEDKSRIRINPDRFAKLRSFALNIFRANKVENIRNERYRNSLNLNRLFKYEWLLN